MYKPQCETPHISEEEIKERFLKVYNGLIDSVTVRKDGVLVFHFHDGREIEG